MAKVNNITDKEKKMEKEAKKGLPYFEKLGRPCNEFFKMDDTVLVIMSGIGTPPTTETEVRDSFIRNHGRIGKIIYAGEKFVTVKYEPNSKPKDGGFAPSSDLSWCESFGTFEIAKGVINLYKR